MADIDPQAPPRPGGHDGAVALVLAIAVAVSLVRHASSLLSDIANTGHILGVLLDAMLTVPVAAVAVWLAGRTVAGLGFANYGRAEWLAKATLVSVIFVPVFAPLAAFSSPLHELIGVAGGEAHAAHAVGLDVAALANHGLANAIAAQPVALVVSLLILSFMVRSTEPDPLTVRRRQGPAYVAVTAALVPVLVAGMFLAPSMGSAPAASAEEEGSVSPASSVGGCATAPVRTYNVLAINLDITVNRFGDHDPFGFMYVQAEKLSQVRAQEAALKANAAEGSDGSGAKVSNGLGQDAIQPLILRARLGECVQINFTNRLTEPARGGPGFGAQPVFTQPGGVPSVSIDLAGVAYDAAAGHGGQAVGNNPTNVMVPPGASRTYRFFLDPLMGEGVRVFRSGGDSTQLTLHGLFGALVAEPAGSTWLDPDTGADRTNDRTFNSFAAIIRPGSGTSFREFALLYHEIGDEQFSLRRPPRENEFDFDCFGPPDEFGSPLPMRDEGGPDNCGVNTNSYRPGGRALNYRSEAFYRRLETQFLHGIQTAEELDAAESLTYGSYANGDPATPMPRSYLGEPTKMRLAHAGAETLHVHHLHGGGDRWPMNPNAVANNFAGGLQKNPPNNASSVMLDSQTMGPSETYDARIECGAGGCQQAAGDFLWHCHIAHHYIAGMWSFWRVFDTRQPNLAVIPGRASPPSAVTTQNLIGRTIEGRTVVTRSTLTNPATQVAVEDLVERQIPPQGVRLDHNDATVWDWQKGGTAASPLYFSEPETEEVWQNYESATPGERPEMMFNPNNGRPAWPMLRPHLGQRPPFAGAGHTGTAWLGDTTSSARPDGLCPSSAPVRTYNITGISVPIQETLRERDPAGTVFVLNEDKQRVLDDANAGRRAPDPLAIRSNVGDCVAITLTNEMDPLQQPKVNMHTHFVQFDPQSSDGVITGLSFEQSVYPNQIENRTVTAAASAGATQVTVSNVDRLRVGIFIAIGSGRANIENRRITAITGTRLTLDRGLSSAHSVGEPASVEFVQYRWYSDVDSGTVFWHDHVNGIESWAHGMFGAHIIEPRGSTYHDPRTGAEVRSGTIVDIRTSNLVGGGVRSSFREYMVFLSNGRRGRAELTGLPDPRTGTGRNAGQECEESSINLRAAPIGERTPPGALQKQEFNGAQAGVAEPCRNATSRVNDPTAANTVAATVTAVDPYVFSSVKYGDPTTPLFRAYAGDPVVIRTIGVTDRVEALRFQGHRFARERFNADGELVDAATTGISERFDYVLDGGAGGPARLAGDYLYYSTRNFAFESGGWGIFRVHDRLQSDLRPLPDRTAPPTGTGFPILRPATGNTQTTPGPNPPPSTQAGVVSNPASACAAGTPVRHYDVAVFNKALPTAPFADNGGIIYSLASDEAAIRAGTKRAEPLVLRANQGDCLEVNLRNNVAAGTTFGGARAGFDLGKLLYNPQTSAGTAVGLNPDTTVAAGQNITLRFAADKVLGTSIFQNLGSVASIRHGAYGQVIVEPNGASYFDSVSGAPLTATRTSSQAIIRSPSGNFREFNVSLGSTDQQFSRSIFQYQDVVAGTGINSPFFPVLNGPVADKAFNNVNYSSAPLTTRLGLTASPPNPDPAWEHAFSSTRFGDPATPIFRAFAGDPVVMRFSVGASDQFHTFSVGGHIFPQDPNMWNGGSDRRSQLLPSRSFAAGETGEIELVGGAGGTIRATGDYLYGDMRQPFTEAGVWGILRVLPTGSPLAGI